jgi:sarcosine oxidase subunit gamma
VPYDVVIRRLPLAVLLDIRADPEARAAALAAGLTLAETPNRVMGSGEPRVLWLGPDQWLVKAAATAEQRLEQAFSEALADRHASVTVVSDHYARFAIAGPDTRDVLAQGCGLDLDRLGAGQCARCRLARIHAVIEPREPMPRYEVLVESALAHYFAIWLERASGQPLTGP